MVAVQSHLLKTRYMYHFDMDSSGLLEVMKYDLGMKLSKYSNCTQMFYDGVSNNWRMQLTVLGNTKQKRCVTDKHLVKTITSSSVYSQVVK
jgi:hypothetical protein